MGYGCYQVTFSRSVLLVSLGILTLTGGVLFFVLPEVDADLENAIRAVEFAIERGDSDGVIPYISPHFESEGKTYQDVSARIRENLIKDLYESIVIIDREVEMVGTVGRVTCRIRFIRPRAVPVPFVEYKVLAEWRQGEKGWRIVSGKAEEATIRK
jgi:hypothetical protein